MLRTVLFVLHGHPRGTHVIKAPDPMARVAAGLRGPRSFTQGESRPPRLGNCQHPSASPPATSGVLGWKMAHPSLPPGAAWRASRYPSSWRPCSLRDEGLDQGRGEYLVITIGGAMAAHVPCTQVN